MNFAWQPLILSAFIFIAASSELTQVRNEERRRRYEGADGDGIWTAPTGYQWVHQGKGVWQLAPIMVTENRRGRSPWL